MDILLVRHGESEANAAGRIQGWLDPPLTEQGRDQARRLKAWLVEQGIRWDAAYASPLVRARETAKILSEIPGAPALVEDPDLREIGLGALEGLNRAEIAEQHPSFLERSITDLGDFTEYGGEAYQGVQDRITGFLTRVTAKHHPENHRVLVVAHGGVNFQLTKAAICVPVPRVCILHWGNCTVTLLRFHERRGMFVAQVSWHVPLEIMGGAPAAAPTGAFR